MVQENADALMASFTADLGKPKMEGLVGEVGAIIDRAMICAEMLKEWAKPVEVDVPEWQKSWNPMVHRYAKGTVLIIA
jgi:aldehyde dehydrogenase (NAD+)